MLANARKDHSSPLLMSFIWMWLGNLANNGLFHQKLNSSEDWGGGLDREQSQGLKFGDQPFTYWQMVSEIESNFNTFTSKIAQVKFRQNLQILFGKICWKANKTKWIYLQRSFTWMVAPQDFINELKSYHSMLG